MVRIISSLLRLMTKEAKQNLIAAFSIITLSLLICNSTLSQVMALYAVPSTPLNMTRLIYGISTWVGLSGICILCCFPRSLLQEDINQRNRYIKYIVLRLVKDLDDIYERHIKNKSEGVDAWMEKCMATHDEMQHAVDLFRLHAFMLLSPEEGQSTLTIQAILNCFKVEEQALCKRYAHLKFEADDDLLMSFLNP